MSSKTRVLCISPLRILRDQRCPRAGSPQTGSLHAAATIPAIASLYDNFQDKRGTGVEAKSIVSGVEQLSFLGVRP